MLVNIQRRTQARPLGDQRPSPAGLLKSCRGQSGSLGLHQTRGGFSNIPDQDLCKEHLSCLDTHVDVNVWITHTHTHTHTRIHAHNRAGLQYPRHPLYFLLPSPTPSPKALWSRKDRMGAEWARHASCRALPAWPPPRGAHPMYCRGWLWWMTILQVGQVLFSSRYFTRQLRQTEGGGGHQQQAGALLPLAPCPGPPWTGPSPGPTSHGGHRPEGQAPSRPSRGACHSSDQINSMLA